MSLNPQETRQQKEAEAAKAKPKPKLNPDFPYRPTEFDPFYFGLDEDPPSLDNTKKT